jgi:FkbM family methyltransferase
VQVFQLALSDGEGTAALHYNPRVPLTTGASLEDGNVLHHDAIVIRRVTLDALGFRNVAAIKIDVERHEPCVLRGALRTIAQDRPTLLIETLDDDMRAEVLRLLPGYTVAAILDGRNTVFISQ